jgi:hypothetical protein
MLVAVYGCVTLYGCASNSGSARSAASFSSVVAPSVPSVPSVPFAWNASPDVNLVPAPEPDIGPRTGGPPRTDCSDATVSGTGQLVHGRGTIVLTSRAGADVCDLAAVAASAQLQTSGGATLSTRYVDPTAAVTTNPPAYGWAQLGHGGPGTNQLTTVSFQVEWDAAYCGPAPTRLLLFDSSWVGNAGVPITVTLTKTSPPCGTTSATAGDGTLAVYPANGYPTASTQWAQLRATIESVTGTSAPSFVVRLTNRTGLAVPLRPCFAYAIGAVSHDTDGGSSGESFDGYPDCDKLPPSLPPHGSLDLPIDPADLRPPSQSDLPGGTWTWLMPGGPSASFEFSPSR